jgi:formylglycine-generating enzyme required for sulfatase activity/dienelactone hydrolase
LKAFAALLLVVAVLAAVQMQRSVEKRIALAAAVVSAESFLSEDKYQAAFAELAPFVDEQGAEVAALLNKLMLPVSIHTDPAGVEIAYRFALPDSEWTSLGVTPLTDLTLPRGHYKLRIGDDLLMDATNPGVALNSAGRAQRVIGLPREPAPDGMVFIPGGEYRLGAWGFLDDFDLGGFFIDRFEVSNRDYQDFIDAGGYQDPAFWQDLIDDSAGKLTWQVIRDEFVDLTGRPGPLKWELGTYPPGEQTLPVVGVSWFEANAYLLFRNKTLPDVHHWLRAALGPMEWKYPFAPELVPHSNVGTTGLLPVGRRSDAEVNGTYDMIGNAAEWTALESNGSKAIIGSSFRDPVWAYNFPQLFDPLQRLDTTGFRGMRAATTSVTGPLPNFPIFNDFSGSIRQVSDEMFAGMKHSFDYTVGTIDARNVNVVSEVALENWIRREVLIPTGRPDDPMPVLLFIPRRYSPPYQSVIYLPPADSWSPGFRTNSVEIENYQIDFVPRAGRVLIWPVYTGSHERYDDYHADAGPERLSVALERNRRVRDEVGRVIDYLESDNEFDGSKVALMALSYGATVAPFILATEPRIGAAVIYSAGIAPPIPIFANPQNDPNVFWARVHQPTVLVNGRYDPIRPHEFVLGPLLDLLATPPDSKRIILYDSAHWPLPRYLMMRDSLDWLDLYLGPPAPQRSEK